jgi:hypothetical protein
MRISALFLHTELVTFSDYAKYMPSMIKFGVPDPVATWALAAGVPLRSAALSMSAVYRAHGALPSHLDFTQWLAQLGTDHLRHEYGITGPLLERIARSLQASGRNPLLTSFTTIEEFLPRQFEVQGAAYENRWIPAASVQPGTPLDLQRDYDNLADRNAIIIKVAGATIGFVPRQLAQVLAPELDSGVQLSVVAKTVQAGRVPRISAIVQGP